MKNHVCKLSRNADDILNCYYLMKHITELGVWGVEECKNTVRFNDAVFIVAIT